MTLYNTLNTSLEAAAVSGNLSVTSGSGITQSGSLTVSGSTELTAGSDNDITLGNSGNAFTGTIAITSGQKYDAVQYP